MNADFRQRSLQDELLDSPNVPAPLLERNLRELDFLNRFSGGHAISLEGIKRFLKDKNKVWHIADLGCGSGDWMRYIADWARRNGFRMQLTGVDKNGSAIEYLNRLSTGYPEIEGIRGDYSEIFHKVPVDLFHCGLFCHHLSDRELVELLSRMHSNSREGFVINDLRRSRMAWYGARTFTKLFGGSPLAQHDGPVSVLRGFKTNELEQLMEKAGVKHYHIRKRPFFRYLVIVANELVP